MFEMPDHELRPFITEILQRAEPKEEVPDLARLFKGIVLYIKRVETGHLSSEESKFPSPERFHFKAIPPSTTLVQSLYDRIRIIREYDIRSVNRIRELLEYGFTRTSQKSIKEEQITVLKKLCENPGLSITQLSKELNLSRPTVKKLLTQMQNDFGLRLGYLTDGSKLKLSAFNIIFRSKSFQASETLEHWIRSAKLPFLKSFVFDLNYRNGFIAFSIPSQQRAFQLLERRVEWLKERFFDYYQMHQMKTLLWDIHFEYYDPKRGRWRIPAEITKYTNLDFLSHLSQNDYRFRHRIDFKSPIKFSQVDYLLAHSEQEGAFTITEKRKFLTRYHIHLSTNTIWSNYNRLKNEGVLIPYLYFSGGGFEEFISFNIICTDKMQILFQILAHTLPFTYTYLTDQGILIFFKRPTGWEDVITHMISEIPNLPGVHDFMVIHQELNIGSAFSLEIYRRWNEKRQFWEFTDDDI